VIYGVGDPLDVVLPAVPHQVVRPLACNPAEGRSLGRTTVASDRHPWRCLCLGSAQTTKTTPRRL